MTFIIEYFKYLANNPHDVNSIILWNISTAVVYVILFWHRKLMIQGASSENGLFELPEQVTYVLNFVWPPITFYAAYFNAEFNIMVWALILGVIAYTIGGRWIFQWVLAFKSGKDNVNEQNK